MLATSPKTKFRRSKRQAFTLIELLMVIAVILILAGITFGITRGVQNAQARTRAKAELASIAQSLEQFKSTNGDYPWVRGEPEEFAKALLGWMEFERSDNGARFVEKDSDDVPPGGPKSFIDPTKLNFTGALPDTPDQVPQIEFIDPWGNAYIYLYKDSAAGEWNNFGYVLYSSGADGRDTPVDDDGILEQSDRDIPENADNIYGGE